jgi:hypothetical protein
MSLLVDTGDGPACEEEIAILSTDTKAAITRDDVSKGLHSSRHLIRVQL